MIQGAQLYTVRDYCKTLDGLLESLEKIADIGYKTVQISGTCDYTPEELSEMLRKTGLKCVLTHYKTDEIINSPEKTVQSHKVFDCKYIGIGALPGGAEGLAEFDTFIERLLPSTKIISQSGAYVMYHNHAFDLERRQSGETYLEKMVQTFPSDQLGFTLDTYWLQAGGVSITEWISKLSGRVPCLHLKDMKICANEQKMARIGAGNINFSSVLSAAEGAKTEYLLVEQDDCYGADPFDELKKSYEYLKAMGIS